MIEVRFHGRGGQGIWPLRGAIHGAVLHSYIPRTIAPVENYLSHQGRFHHLFEPRRDEVTIAHIHATVDAYWKSARAEPGEQHASTTGGSRAAVQDEGWVSSR